MYFSVVYISFYLTLLLMGIGFGVTLIAWVKDYEKLEKIGIRIGLLGVFMALLCASSCTLGILTIH